MAYGDDTLDSGVRDERRERWNTEGYDTGRIVCMVLNPYKERKIRKIEDVIYDDDNVFNILCTSTCPASTQRLQPRIRSV